MAYVIDREYLFQLIDAITDPAIHPDQEKLYLLKKKFPEWLQRIVFSSFNPLYVYFIFRGAMQQRQFYNSKLRNQFTIDFMKYCLTKDIHLDVHHYYPEKDHSTVRAYVENRVKSLFLDNLRLDEFYSEKGISEKIRKKLKVIIRKTGRSAYIWNINGKPYYISTMPEISAAYFHLGLPNLPDRVMYSLEGTTFLDAGAYNGDTALSLLPFNPLKILCFEPDDANFNLLNDTIQNNHLSSIIEAFKIGVGENDNEMTFKSQGIMSSKISEKGNIKIPVRKIDTLAKDIQGRIGLIKMDIEGFEFEALKGAKNTLQQHQPVLIISAYHTGKDFFEIPPLLKKFVPDYHLRFLDLEPISALLGEKIILAYHE